MKNNVKIKKQLEALNLFFIINVLIIIYLLIWNGLNDVYTFIS